MSWDQLVAGVELPFPEGLTVPELHPFPLEVPSPPGVHDVEAAAFTAAIDAYSDDVNPGMTVAVGAGSRGLTGRVELVRGTIRALRQLGAEPFVVPAMGSHGGATAEGQRQILHDLGITEESVGAEIRATMDTVVVAHTSAGTPVHLDANAAAADRFLPVNRVKPHTCFKGPVESGCMKMAVVGFGKQPGAALVHTCGPIEMRDRLLDACAALRESGRLLGGIASIEAGTGEIVRVEGLRTNDVGGDYEHELTEYARTLVPPLPFDEIDVLVIEKGGKDISGTTMDPNVTGRFWVPGLADLEKPRVSAIVLLDLTEVSGGNALGMGFADFIPASLANQLDFRKTYINCFTAGPAGMRRARMPMVLPDEESCIKAAVAMCGRGDGEPIRMVRIASTLHLTECQVSDALLP
ncbi:uncharacterized protein DUF362 [Ilumatobacter fluminis]|uniref:Uncharacterized protein DUF362 n=1 Tax=Ilumatobacter fluminis TaxID=467091 RepID=A0A4R7I4X2_9ACTN|nr:DUF362 domain-containing protein [Ilumatobacter fluminis]TDT18575.1 uncharacterized protein DUF362 [Ilumatobacter fluminis]